MNKLSVRTIAANIVYEARYNNGYINKQLQNIQHLSNEDIRLLTTICYGSIKNFDYLYSMFEHMSDVAKNKPKAKAIIVVAMFQYVYLDKVPTYAILNAAVEDAKKLLNQHVASYINATLRKVLQIDKIEEHYLTYLQTEEYTTRLSIMYSFPEWLIKMLLAQYKEKTPQFLTAIQQDSKQFVRVNILRSSSEELLQSPEFITTTVDNALEYVHGNVAGTDYFTQGKLSIQNLSSQLVAKFVDPQPDELILDMCAAPGGKTTHLAELSSDCAKIVAYDLYPLRVQQIEQNIERLGLKSIKAEVGDALIVSDVKYDKILLDVPCSGLGVMCQKPEIRYHLQPANLDELIILQQKLLDSAWEQLTTDGELIYSTCTINRKENEKQIQYLLQKYPQAKLIEERLILDEMDQGYSGFYMAKILKEK